MTKQEALVQLRTKMQESMVASKDYLTRATADSTINKIWLKQAVDEATNAEAYNRLIRHLEAS